MGEELLVVCRAVVAVDRAGPLRRDEPAVADWLGELGLVVPVPLAESERLDDEDVIADGCASLRAKEVAAEMAEDPLDPIDLAQGLVGVLVEPEGQRGTGAVLPAGSIDREVEDRTVAVVGSRSLERAAERRMDGRRGVQELVFVRHRCDPFRSGDLYRCSVGRGCAPTRDAHARGLFPAHGRLGKHHPSVDSGVLSRVPSGLIPNHQRMSSTRVMR